MPKLPRILAKIFASNAAEDDIGQFGSALTGSKVLTSDIAQIQALPAYEEGWRGAVISNRNYPTLQETNGVLKNISQQLAYLFQQGLPEWDSETTYYTNSFCQVDGVIYKSLTDENVGNKPTEDTTNWEVWSAGGSGSGLPIGFIGQSIVPVDETKGLERNLNGSKLSINANTKGILNKLKQAALLYPSLAAPSQEAWDAISARSIEGQCGKIFINEDEGYIQLPRVTKVQGCLTLANIGDIVDAGIPNTPGQFNGYTANNATSCTGPFSSNNNTFAGPSNVDNNIEGQNITYFNPSTVSSLYRDNFDNIQEEAIQYPYFIVIATGAEEEVNIVNKYELNNPFVLLEPKYFEKAPYNSSWLLTSEGYYPKGRYSSVYNALLIEQNPEIEVGQSVTIDGWTYVKRGWSVKNSTDSDITDYDYVINQDNETFRTILKSKLASGSAVVGNKHPLIYTSDSLNEFGLYCTNTNTIAQSELNPAVGILPQLATSNQGVPNRLIGLSTDPVKSGAVTDSSELKLYIYVGETVQNPNLINAGRIQEQIANIQSQPHIIKTYVNGTSGYIIWSNSYGVQWGRGIASTNYSATDTVVLLKKFADTSYNVQLVVQGESDGKTLTARLTGKYSIDKFGVVAANENTFYPYPFTWTAKGYLAEGEYINEL